MPSTYCFALASVLEGRAMLKIQVEYVLKDHYPRGGTKRFHISIIRHGYFYFKTGTGILYISACMQTRTVVVGWRYVAAWMTLQSWSIFCAKKEPHKVRFAHSTASHARSNCVLSLTFWSGNGTYGKLQVVELECAKLQRFTVTMVDED